jgi:hypothetical protein
MRNVFGIGFSVMLQGCVQNTSPIEQTEQEINSVLSGINCGQPGSYCEVLAQKLPGGIRSLSKIQNDGSFFIGSAGNPFNDLFAEAIVGPGSDIDNSTIYKYTNTTGLQPWITQKPSQLLVVVDPVFGGPTPFQAGINGVEVRGDDLFYTITYNSGTTDYVSRMRGYTVDSGFSFGELHKISGGVTNPVGQDIMIADVAAQEIANGNPDNVTFLTPDPFGHQVGDPALGTNPYGLLPLNNKTYVVDVAANDLYQVKNNGNIDLVAVFPSFNGGERVPINILEGPNNKLYVTFFYGINANSTQALGGVARVKNNGTFEMVSFNRLPISAVFGPDGFLYVLEFANQLAPSTGRILKTSLKNYNDFNGRPQSDGVVVVDNLDYPVDLEFDAQGCLVVLETGDLNPFYSEARVLRFDL